MKKLILPCLLALLALPFLIVLVDYILYPVWIDHRVVRCDGGADGQ